MEKKLSGKKVAIIATNGFEQSELEKPLEALKENGAVVEIISLKKGKIKGWKDKEWGDEIEATICIEDAKNEDYDALVLPGGVMNPDQLRVNKDVVAFAKAFMEDKKTVAAICHGPWTLIETGKLRGKKMTSFKSIKTDLINAGVVWVDEEVVVDDNLVTSRSPKDLPTFCKKMIEEIKNSKQNTLLEETAKKHHEVVKHHEGGSYEKADHSAAEAHTDYLKHFPFSS